MKEILILGSTGSIGTSTLNVIRRNPELFKVSALIAGNNIAKLIEQIKEFNPKHVYIKNSDHADILHDTFPTLDIYHSEKGLYNISCLTDFDIAVSALVGVAGLMPTYNIIKNSKTIALANKEVLVTGGELIMNTASLYGSKLLTVDSEHSAIMQCLNGENHKEINKIILTSSGGPFFDKEITENITITQALSHPTWKMGGKITIDSATMMNKGFEVIEAKWLFNVPIEKIEVVVEQKSILHSAVEFADGSIMANMGPKSMEIPISYALNYPNRIINNIPKLNLFEVGKIEFKKPDLNKFKCLKLALDAVNTSHSAQIVLNTANEVAVNLFLTGKINFTDIPKIIEKTLSTHIPTKISSIEDILELDSSVRETIC